MQDDLPGKTKSSGDAEWFNDIFKNISASALNRMLCPSDCVCPRQVKAASRASFADAKKEI